MALALWTLAGATLPSAGGFGDGGSDSKPVETPPETPPPDDEKPAEYRVKAAVLPHFIRYTTWPKSTFKDKKAPYRLLVVGKDPFGKILDQAFHRKTFGGRAVVIERATKVPEKLEAHVVFAGELKAEERAALLALCADLPVLLVGEVDGFAAQGACVNLYLDKKKVRFEINPGAAKRAGLSISSELLKLAKIVKTRR